MNGSFGLETGGAAFSTREYAQAENLPISAASKRLARYAGKGWITPLTRGIWANRHHPGFSALACVPRLLGNEQGYVSFLTALHRHGLLSQIPSTIQVATTGHSRQLNTPVGVYEFFKLKPELMREGVEWNDSRSPFLIATPEKALIDTLYIATRKRKRFQALPEIDFEETGFDPARFERLLEKMQFFKPIETAIRRRFQQIEGLAGKRDGRFAAR